MLEFFTNKEKTKKDEVDVASPAFSLTKVQATLGLFITAIVGVVPPALKDDPSVMVASIAAGAAVMLGVFYLAAVDLKTRQRAAEATLRFPDGDAPKKAFNVVPVEDDLRIQKGPGADEYKVRFAEVSKGQVELLAAHNGDVISVPLKEPKSK
ncbi:MAG: hypothetical protein QOI84_1101 [Solirubrobacterales bacterium]|jgi:hypothetical protein|nr:hypothetical protein [Solirubrobacterales bacterium]